MRLSLAFALSATALLARPALGQEKPTDAQILGILSAANTGEITEGQLAQSKASNKEVKKYAEEMVKDHRKMDTDGNNLASKLKITPEESSTSLDLKRSSQDTMAKLQSQTGPAFDSTYADAMVADHEKVLTTIDKELIPNAQNKQLRSMLHKARNTIAEHLKHAKHMQQKIGSRQAARDQ